MPKLALLLDRYSILPFDCRRVLCLASPNRSAIDLPHAPA